MPYKIFENALNQKKQIEGEFTFLSNAAMHAEIHIRKIDTHSGIFMTMEDTNTESKWELVRPRPFWREIKSTCPPAWLNKGLVILAVIGLFGLVALVAFLLQFFILK